MADGGGGVVDGGGGVADGGGGGQHAGREEQVENNRNGWHKEGQGVFTMVRTVVPELSSCSLVRRQVDSYLSL